MSAPADAWGRVVDPRTVAIEETIREIEQETRHRLDLEERVAVEFALQRFADRLPRFDPTAWLYPE